MLVLEIPAERLEDQAAAASGTAPAPKLSAFAKLLIPAKPRTVSESLLDEMHAKKGPSRGNPKAVEVA
jgi:hypothetical protein